MDIPTWRETILAWRDIILFFAGLGLTIYEAVARHGSERPGFLFLYGAMMGLSAVLRGTSPNSGSTDHRASPNKTSEAD